MSATQFPIFIGLAGGSGSGKTTFAKMLQTHLGLEKCEILYQDCFYRDQSHRFDRDGGSVNFDHPDAIDFLAIASAIQNLKTMGAAKIPIYDFATHKRKSETLAIYQKDFILIDGILIFHSEEVRGFFDYRLYFETPEEVRFQRRLERDVRERGRTPEGVRAQFYSQVKPMHDLYVEPSKCFADRVVTERDSLDLVLKEVVERFAL